MLQVFINKIFQGTDIYLSESGLLLALCAICFYAFLLHSASKDPLNFVPLSTHIFLVVLSLSLV